MGDPERAPEVVPPEPLKPVKLASKKPTRKLRFGAAVGASVAIAAWIVRSVWHIEVPAEVAAAATVVASSLAAYFAKAHPEDLEAEEPE